MFDDRIAPNLFGPGERLSRLLERLDISSDPSQSTQWSALVVGLLVALPPFLLSVLAGTAWGNAVEIPFLRDWQALSRLVVVVPALVFAARAVGIQLGVATRYLDASSVVPGARRGAYEDASADLVQRSNSRSVQVLLLVFALAAPWFGFLWFDMELSMGLSSWLTAGSDVIGLSPAGWYYMTVSQPIVAFYLLFWGWRYVTWLLFLRRVGGLDLALQPAHPDLAGGLAPLVRAHASFALAGFAVNAALSGAIANEVLYIGRSVAEAKWEILFFVGTGLLVLAAPLLRFVPDLVQAKSQGIVQYGRLGHELTADFDARWRIPGGEPKLLDTADPSAMADFAADYDTVKRMRVYPLGLRQLAGIGVLLFVPFGALALTQMSVFELITAMAEKLF